MQSKMGLVEGIFLPTVLYGCETWSLNAREQKRVEVMEMKALRAVCGVTWRDRVRNVEVREMRK